MNQEVMRTGPTSVLKWVTLRALYLPPRRLMQATIDKIMSLNNVTNALASKIGKVFNTGPLYAIEVGYGPEVAEAMVHLRSYVKNSRGAPTLDDGCMSVTT